MISKITAKIVFRSYSTKILNFWKLKKCFLQYFYAVQLRLKWTTKMGESERPLNGWWNF